MKSTNKARLITALICALLCLMFADIVAIWPRTLPYILGAFAVPGAWKFARTLYIWLITDDPEPVKIALPSWWPFKKKRKLTYEDYANAGGVRK